MNRRVVIGILVVLLLAVVAVTVGGFAYQAGVAQGLANSGSLVAPDGGGVAPYYFYGAPGFRGGPWGWGWGFGFGFLRCLFPLLGFFLIFALLRGFFWRGGHWGGRRGWGGPGGEGGAPQMFEEWHRQAHGESAPKPGSGGQPSGG